MMSLFVSVFSIVAIGSELGNEEAGSNGTMISELDKYSGLELNDAPKMGKFI